MRLTALLSALLITAIAAPASIAQGSDVFGNRITVPAVRPPLEPGAAFAGNDQAVLAQLRELVARPEADSAAVVAEMEAYSLKKLAPVLLFEYARRLKLVGKADWRYWYEAASLAAKYHQRACKDRTAPQFVTVALMEYGALLEQHGDTSDFLNVAGADDDARWQAMRQVLVSGDGFNSEASAWWICSHGMSAMRSGMSGQPLSLDSWWTGADAMKQARGQAESAIDGMLKQMGF